MKQFLERAFLVAAVITFAGCANTSVNKEAFAKPKKIAVVTISGSAHGMFTSDDEDAKILADSVPVCLGEISKSSHVHLLPAKAALSAKAYAAIKDEGPTFTLQLVPGYKQFSLDTEKKNLHALAKELHVDGFLILALSYSQVQGAGVGIGFISISSKKPSVATSVVAVTPDGEVLWKGYAQIVGDDGIVALNGIGAYSKLVAQLKGITQTACQQTVKDLAEQVALK